MFSLAQTLCAGAVLLVVTASIPAPRKPNVAWGWVLCLTMLGLGSLIVHGFVREFGYATNIHASERAKYVKRELEKSKAKNVLWIDGGSFPNKAVSRVVLKSELKKLGYDVDVMHLAIGGANHFERQAMYRRLRPLLDKHPRRRKKRQRWIYLPEVHRSYDLDPLGKFTKNLETARLYSYLTPRIVWDAFWAMGSAETKADEPVWRERFELFRHGLVYAFNAGINTRLVPSKKIRAAPGDRLLGTPKEFLYTGIEEVISAATMPQKHPIPPWVFDVRERNEESTWGKHIKDWVYFGVPSTRPKQMHYTMSFCAATRRKCIAPDDRKLLKSLDARTNWIDEGHMSASGARIYSKWLAKKLHESGALTH